MQNSPIVTLNQLNSAFLAVQDEFYRLGLWNEKSRLPRTEVIWCSIPQITLPSALGFFINEATILDPILGYQVGNIYIPQWVIMHGIWKNRGSLRDVVRHEYAHAVEYHYPMLTTRSKRFKTAFSGPYPGDYDEVGNFYVSKYASTQQTEDFAETFMIFVRHGGKIPNKLKTTQIKHKWKFIAELCEVIDSGAAKW
jgi:hypothetical protein